MKKILRHIEVILGLRPRPELEYTHYPAILSDKERELLKLINNERMVDLIPDRYTCFLAAHRAVEITEKPKNHIGIEPYNNAFYSFKNIDEVSECLVFHRNDTLKNFMFLLKKSPKHYKKIKGDYQYIGISIIGKTCAIFLLRTK